MNQNSEHFFGRHYYPFFFYSMPLFFLGGEKKGKWRVMAKKWTEFCFILKKDMLNSNTRDNPYFIIYNYFIVLYVVNTFK